YVQTDRRDREALDFPRAPHLVAAGDVQDQKRNDHGGGSDVHRGALLHSVPLDPTPRPALSATRSTLAFQPRLLPDGSRLRLAPTGPSRAQHVALGPREHGFYTRDLAIDKFEDLRVEHFIRIAHPLGERHRLTIQRPSLDIAPAREVESREHELPLDIDDRK